MDATSNPLIAVHLPLSSLSSIYAEPKVHGLPRARAGFSVQLLPNDLEVKGRLLRQHHQLMLKSQDNHDLF